MPATTAAKTAQEFAWIGTTLGTQFASQLMARQPDADEALTQRLNGLRSARSDAGKADATLLRNALVALRTLPISFALDIERAIETRFVERLTRLQLTVESRLGFSLDSLSLVDDEQMREDLAVTRAAQSLREDVGAEFYGLTRRLCHVIERDGIPDSENPGFPGTLLLGLLDALRPVADNRDTLLTLFDALIPEVEQIIVSVYRAVNAEMVRRGVLITVEDTIINRGRAPATSGATAGVAGAGQSGGGAAPGEAPSGGASSASGSGAIAQTDGTPTAAHSAGGARANPLERTGFFHAPMDATAPGYVLVSQREFERSLAAREALLANQAAARAPAEQRDRVRVDRESLSPMGFLTLGLEQLAFDARLESAGSEVWDLLAPVVLRAAQEDPTVISTDERCVRQCIDRFAEFIFTQQVAPGSIDGSYEALIDVARWLDESSKSSPRAFEMAAERLEAMTDQFESSAASTREETRIIAQFELTEAARNAARDAINQAFSQGGVPERVKRFADETAFGILVSDYLNGGREGELWQSDVETLNMLVASLRPIRTREQRAALTTQLPIMVARLSSGLARTSRTAADLRAFLDDLKPIYEALARNETAVDEESKPVVTEPTLDVSEYERTAALVALPNLRSLRWVAFTDRNGGNEVRCRLVWQSPTRSTYLFRSFTDREYFALTVDELAQRFRGGMAKHIAGLEIASQYLRRTA